MKEEIKGEMSPDMPKPKGDDMITKEETMFKMGDDGKVIPEKYPVKLYDRQIDSELIDESIRLLAAIKKQKAIEAAIADANQKQAKEISDLKEKLEKESDDKVKRNLQAELSKLQNIQVVEDFKTAVNANIVSEGIKESREMIAKLDKMKAESIVEKFVELQPCNSSEAYLVFEKGKTVDGKDTSDHIADVISRKITNPKYTFEEAKNLKADYKIALKDAIMEASGYRVKNYREIMMEARMNPLAAKKGQPSGS